MRPSRFLASIQQLLPMERPSDLSRHFSLSSFPSWLPEEKGGKIRTTIPLTDPLPGLATSQGYHAPSEPTKTEVTRLENGVRVISEATPGPTASMGIYVNSGSIYEQPSQSGCSALLECLSFKSTHHRSSTRIQQEVEKIGSNIMANASREQMSYTTDCLKTHAPAALELLCDSVLNPLLLPDEIDDQKARLQYLLSSKDAHTTLLIEKLVQGAYEGALGHPLIPDPERVTIGSGLSSSDLHAFLKSNYAGNRIILTASGMDHSKLVDLVKPMLISIPSGDDVPEPTSHYQGAFVHLPGSNPQPSVILAFEYKGGWRDVKGAVAMTVLTYLLGGGSSFSSGGPGKGMHSRLYTRVLSQYYWAHSCSSFNSTFNDSGLVGIQGSCDPKHVNTLVNVMCSELELVAKAVGQVELDRAKRAAVSIICNALESKATSSEDIGRQFLTYGRRISGAEYVQMIESLTPSDLSEFVSRLLESKPSLAVHGDNAESVKYSQVLARYGRAETVVPPPGQAKAKTSIFASWGAKLRG